MVRHVGSAPTAHGSQTAAAKVERSGQAKVSRVEPTVGQALRRAAPSEMAMQELRPTVGGGPRRSCLPQERLLADDELRRAALRSRSETRRELLCCGSLTRALSPTRFMDSPWFISARRISTDSAESSATALPASIDRSSPEVRERRSDTRRPGRCRYRHRHRDLRRP